MRDIHYIVIHCSATRADRTLGVEDLRRLHMERGFKDTGYHYYIRRDGTVHLTRPLEQPGAHVRGMNAHSIGICYEGGLDAKGLPKDTRTTEQRTTMRLLVAQLLKRFPDARVCGHRDFSADTDGDGVVEPREWSTLCPCFDVAKEL